MMISIPPKYAMSQVIGFIKGKSAIHLARVYGERKQNFAGQSFWARGYFVSTVGRDEATSREYIRNQEKEDHRLDQLNMWAEHKLDWLRQYLPLSHGIPSHDTFGRLFGLIDPGQFEAAFRRWMQSACCQYFRHAQRPRWWPSTGRPVAVPAAWMLRRGIWFRPSRRARAWSWGSG
jgi:putative transposase